MLTSGVSLVNQIKSSHGIQSVEQRVHVLESRIRQLTGEQPVNTLPQNVQPTPASFKNTLSKLNASTSVEQTNGATLTVSGSVMQRYKTLQPVIKKLSEKYNMDPKLINAVVKQESGFQPEVVSKAGAQGLMQLMPQTAKSLNVTNPLDPVQNLDGGIRYLKGLMSRFNNNIPLALAAYNAGPNAVKKYGTIPPYKETQNYVKNILATYLKL